jgi:hypothetical protein
MLTVSFGGVQVALYPNKTILYVVLGIVAIAALAMIEAATLCMSLINFVLTASPDTLFRLSGFLLAILLSVLFMRFGYPVFFRRQSATGTVV